MPITIVVDASAREAYGLILAAFQDAAELLSDRRPFPLWGASQRLRP